MKKFLSFFVTDIAWKLIALALAMVLWFVGAQVNDPSRSRTYNLPLQLHNSEILATQGLVIIDEYPLDIHVRLGVRASRSVLDNLGDDINVLLEYITPVVDLRAIDSDYIRASDGPVTMRLDIGANLDWDKGLELFSISPRFVYVDVDTIEVRAFSVAIDVINEVAPGFELRQIQLANHNVSITAPRAVMARVDSVHVAVDVATIHSVQAVPNLPLVVRCNNGNDITSLVQLSVTETTATVHVLQVETVEVRVQTSGEVASGFALAEINLEPISIDVIGTPDRLEELEYILIPLYLDGINSNQYINQNVLEFLPTGVFLSSDTVPYVQLSITVEPIERRIFNIPRDNVRIRGIDAIYQILSEQQTLRVEVSGPRSVINELHYTDIGLELDLRNRNIGTHDVTLAVYLPGEVTLATAAPILQVQIHEPATEADDYDYYYIDDELQEPQYPTVELDEYYEYYGYYEYYEYYDEATDA